MAAAAATTTGGFEGKEEKKICGLTGNIRNLRACSSGKTVRCLSRLCVSHPLAHFLV
jgi:hypothetical protein